jgi:hypothetical protein
MTYNTTFNLGDTVYFLLDNKIRKGRIESISFTKKKLKGFFFDDRIIEEETYKLNGYKDYVPPVGLYKTLDELVKSLKEK